MVWKVLGRRKFFTFVSLFGIGFTLTALMIVVAIADHQLAPSYPETRLDRTLFLDRMRMFGEKSSWYSGPGFQLLDEYARDLPGVERMAIFTRPDEATTFKDGRKLVFSTCYADAEYWRIMQFTFFEGAPYSADDDAGARRVAIISEATRYRLFGQEPGLGRTFELNGKEFQVVGVVRDVPIYRTAAAAEIWLPLHNESTSGFFDRPMGGSQAIFLLAPDADRRQVQAAFHERLTRFEFEDPERFHTIEGTPMTQLEVLSNHLMSLDPGQMAPRRLILIAALAMLVFMALPAINLVNINLSRINERSVEIGVRKSFGAANPDLVLQFVVENVVLCLFGGVIGLISSLLLLKIATLFPQVPFITFQMNWRIFVAAFAFATLFGVLSGVWPAWKMAKQHPVIALKGGTS
jgi:putative ABC transport system permease protein